MPSWIRKAVPFKHEKPWKCKRFKPSSKAEFSGNECRTSFNPHEEKDCDKWVFATDEVTIVKEVSMPKEKSVVSKSSFCSCYSLVKKGILTHLRSVLLNYSHL